MLKLLIKPLLFIFISTTITIFLALVIGRNLNSPLLTFMGYVGDQRDILLTDTRTYITANLTKSSYDEWHFAWSPDGETLLYTATTQAGRGDTLRLLTLKNGVLTDVAQDDITIPFSPVWSPDSTQIAYFSSYPRNVSDVYIIGRDSTTPRNITRTDLQNEHSPQWSPDGTALVFSRERDIYMQSFDSDEAIPLSVSRDVEAMPHWLATNRIVYYRSTFTYSLLVIYDVETGEEHELDFGTNVKQYTPAISPDERYIVFSTNRNELLVVDVMTGDVVNTLENRERLLTSAWSPDGRYIAFNEASQQISLWEQGTDTVIPLQLGVRAVHQPIAWRP